MTKRFLATAVVAVGTILGAARILTAAPRDSPGKH